MLFFFILFKSLYVSYIPYAAIPPVKMIVWIAIGGYII